MSIILEDEKMVSVCFNSISELMDYEQEPDVDSYNRKRFEKYIGRTSTNETFRPRELGPYNSTRKEVIEHALLGHPEMFKKLKVMMKQLDQATGKNTMDYEQNISVVKRMRKRDYFGDELDIHKVYQGQLDKAWERRQRIEVDSKMHLVTILIDYVGNWDENATNSLWRSAVACRIAEELESAGKTVKIMVGSMTNSPMQYDRRKSATSIVIKDYNQPLNLERLAAMTHLGFFRTFGFAALCAHKYKVNSGLGYSDNIRADNLPIQLAKEVDAGHTRFVHIGRASTLDQAIRYLEGCYNQLKDLSN